MNKLIELDKDRYEKFVKNNTFKSHFLQSYYWGEFSKEKKNLTPYYLGLINDKDEILGTCLLLQKHLPLGYSYFYSPRGFVIDFNNEDLLKKMTQEVVNFTKQKKSIFLKIDPDIIRKKYNYLDQEIELNYNSDKIFNSIINCGFKHLGFTKNFETMQPRYTFRVDLTQNMDDITNHFSKTTMQRINKAKNLGCDVKIGDISDIDEFYHLMTLTENRKDFVSYSKEYYKRQFEILSNQGMAKLFLGSVDTKKIINNLKDQREEVKKDIDKIDIESNSKSSKNKLNNLNSRLNKLNNEIEKYSKYQQEYGQVITLNAHMIIIYDDKAWVLYAGNHNILTESYANYNTYFEHLKYCKDNGIKIYDQFGTVGDLSKDNPRLGLHEFKKKFGGDYVEFLGEFDYIQNHFMYFVFTKLVPLYRNVIRRKTKKEVAHEVKGNK